MNVWGGENNPVESHYIKAGDLVITPPNVAHTMIFLEDSTLLNLVAGEREHENFGKHTIPYELVKHEEILMYKEKHSSEIKNA